MDITEEDLFKYILSPDEIDAEKKEFIHSNENLYTEQIEFCKAILKSAGDKTINLQSKYSAERISAKTKAGNIKDLV